MTLDGSGFSNRPPPPLEGGGPPVDLELSISVIKTTSKGATNGLCKICRCESLWLAGRQRKRRVPSPEEQET